MRHAAAALLVLLLCGMGGAAEAAAVCAAPGEASAQDGALVVFARRAGLRYPEAFRAIVDHLYADHGAALPGCYLTKRAARRRGWRPGGNLWRVAPGAAIGGDRFFNREGRLPRRWNTRYVEADLDYAGGHRGAHRLIFVRGMAPGQWLFFVSLDHDRSFVVFMPAAAFSGR